MDESYVRNNWGKALASVKDGTELSHIIGYGLTSNDISELAKLHMANKHREKIYALLEDCNFHYENGKLMNGEYHELIKDEFGASEPCPYCECENHYPNWDVKKQGYIAVCEGCGKEIYLCDMCLHTDEEGNDCEYTDKCDWNNETNTCYRTNFPANKGGNYGKEQ